MTQDVVSVGDGFNVTYDCANGYHNVYVGLKGKVRRVSFDDKEAAHNFLMSISNYRNVKENV